MHNPFFMIIWLFNKYIRLLYQYIKDTKYKNYISTENFPAAVLISILGARSMCTGGEFSILALLLLYFLDFLGIKFCVDGDWGGCIV